MSQTQTIFWDWNGTLLNDVSECLEIINVSLKKRSLKRLHLDEYLQKFEFPVKQYYENIGFDFNLESFEKAGQEYIEAYAKKMFDCSLHNGALTALKKAKQLGARQFVLSALNHDALKQCISRFELGQFFEMTCGLGDSYAHSKIDLGMRMLKESNCDTKSALMIGDTVHDFETAQAMGINCVLIAAGHNSRERLEACKVPVYKNLQEFTRNFCK